MTLPTERNLTADRLAQYVKRNRCERFLRFSLFKSEADSFARRYGVRLETLSSLLAESGQSYEREVVRELATNGATVQDLFNKPSADFSIQSPRKRRGKFFIIRQNLPVQSG